MLKQELMNKFPAGTVTLPPQVIVDATDPRFRSPTRPDPDNAWSYTRRHRD
jgi:hypothetical protein